MPAFVHIQQGERKLLLVHERSIWGALRAEFGNSLENSGGAAQISIGNEVFLVQWRSLALRLNSTERPMSATPPDLKGRLERALRNALPRKCTWQGEDFILTPSGDRPHKIVITKLHYV